MRKRDLMIYFDYKYKDEIMPYIMETFRRNGIEMVMGEEE